MAQEEMAAILKLNSFLEEKMTIHARQCSGCGQGMSEGYYGIDGTYGCSNDCWFTDGYTREIYAVDFENDAAYHTAWTIEDAIDEGEGWDDDGNHYTLTNETQWKRSEK